MSSKFISQRFEIPVQHRLNIDHHSPRRHGHNLFVTVKVKSNQDDSLKLKLSTWVESFKETFVSQDLEQFLPHPTTEQVLNYIVSNLQQSLNTFNIHEVQIQETSKNQFVWTNPKNH